MNFNQKDTAIFIFCIDRTVTVRFMMWLTNKKGEITMKKTSVIAVGAAAAVGVMGVSLGKKVKVLCRSLSSFKDENLAHTFQHTPEIQPTKKIGRGCGQRRRDQVRKIFFRRRRGHLVFL